MTRFDTRHWPDDERKRHDELCRQAWAAGETASARGNEFEDLITAEEEADSRWARELLNHACRAGLWAHLKDHMQRNHRLLFAHDGRLLTKSALIGVWRQDSKESPPFQVQALIQTATYEEVRRKRAAWLKQRDAYDVNVAYMDRALALEVLVPGSISPAEALEKLNRTAEEWFAGVRGEAA